MSSFRCISLIAIVVSAGAFAAQADASTIFSSGGAAQYGFETGTAFNIALEAGWSSTSAWSNVSIAADLSDFPAGADEVQLTTAIGPAETPQNLVATTDIESATEEGLVTVFSGLNLSAGNYYLVVAEATPGADAGSWWGTGSASTPVAAAGVSFLGRWKQLQRHRQFVQSGSIYVCCGQRVRVDLRCDVGRRDPGTGVAVVVAGCRMRDRSAGSGGTIRLYGGVC